MNKALWIVVVVLAIIAFLQYAQYVLQYDYLYDNIPTCTPEKEEGMIS